MWEVTADADRERWTYEPSISVGPLRFGMSQADAVAALAGFSGTPAPVRADRALKVEFRRAAAPSWSYRGAVTAYFGPTEGLFCVVPDGPSGPQVVLDGIELVGRVPSQVEAKLKEYLPARGAELRYQPEGDPAAEDLGLVMRAQRAGDVVLTRPVFAVVRPIAYTVWDSLPTDELSVH